MFKLKPSISSAPLMISMFAWEPGVQQERWLHQPEQSHLKASRGLSLRKWLTAEPTKALLPAPGATSSKNPPASSVICHTDSFHQTIISLKCNFMHYNSLLLKWFLEPPKKCTWHAITSQQNNRFSSPAVVLPTRALKGLLLDTFDVTEGAMCSFDF